jgi:hypothetical protein
MQLKNRFLFVLAFAGLTLAGGCSYVSNNAGNSNIADSRNSNQADSNGVNKISTRNNARTPTIEATKTEPKKDGNRISFAPGESSATVSGALIRGEQGTHILGAKGGQTMTVKITAEENNAVFQIESPNGKYVKGAGETDDATNWTGPLPASGDYKIIVGGTRGNASYKLTVSIK